MTALPADLAKVRKYTIVRNRHHSGEGEAKEPLIPAKPGLPGAFKKANPPFNFSTSKKTRNSVAGSRHHVFDASSRYVRLGCSHAPWSICFFGQRCGLVDPPRPARLLGVMRTYCACAIAFELFQVQRRL